MKQEIKVVTINEANKVSLSDVRVKTLDEEHPCGEDESVTERLGLGITNDPQEGSLLISLENEKGEVFFNIIFENGRMSFKRVAKRPKNNPVEIQELCETENMGLQWLSESDRKKIRSNAVKIVVGEFRLRSID